MVVGCLKCKTRITVPDHQAEDPARPMVCPQCKLKFPLGKAPVLEGEPIRRAEAITEPRSPRGSRPKSGAPRSSASSGGPGLPMGLIGAAAGAAVGAGLWAGIAAATGYEIGWIAWIVGLLVGVGARTFGGASASNGFFCAILAVAAILVGKGLAVRLAAPKEIARLAEQKFNPAGFEEMKKDSADYATVSGDDSTRRFMVTHGFTEATDATAVTAEEVGDFEKYNAPRLRRFRDERPDFDSWKRYETESFTALVMSELDFVSAVKASLGAMDLLFIGLGLVTAYKAGTGQSG